VLDRLGEQAAIDWSRAVVDAASVRAKKGPADRPQSGRPRQTGSKLHVLTDAGGLPLAVAVSAANTHDSLALIRWCRPSPPSAPAGAAATPAGKLHADKGYDYPHLRAWLRARRITPRIARRGVETATRLGRHRWVVERSFAWLTGYRRLTLATSAPPGCSPHSSPWPPRSPATRNSPRETSS
jgi:transposase